MALITPPPAAPQRGDRTTFASRVDAFITWLINFVTELVSLVSGLNSIAAGGAYAIPYTYSSGHAVVTGGGASQASATFINFDWVAADGANHQASLSMMVASTSTAKGQIRLQALNDPSKWLLYNVSSINHASGYSTVFVTPVDASSANPFITGDSILLYFQRTGDKGDSSALTSIMHVREQQSTGTAGGTSAAAGMQTRTLNTVVRNTISGASLASNQVTLPVGTYRIYASAPAVNSGMHSLRLIDASDSSILAYGSAEYSAVNAQTRSVITVELLFATSKTVYLQHYTAASRATDGLGVASSNGSAVFSEMFIEKVS